MKSTERLDILESTRTERRCLALAASAHVVHDGYTDLLYVLLPVWQAEFGLGYAEVGTLRGSYMATMSALQVVVADDFAELRKAAGVTDPLMPKIETALQVGTR